MVTRCAEPSFWLSPKIAACLSTKERNKDGSSCERKSFKSVTANSSGLVSDAICKSLYTSQFVFGFAPLRQ